MSQEIEEGWLRPLLLTVVAVLIVLSVAGIAYWQLTGPNGTYRIASSQHGDQGIASAAQVKTSTDGFDGSQPR